MGRPTSHEVKTGSSRLMQLSLQMNESTFSSPVVMIRQTALPGGAYYGFVQLQLLEDIVQESTVTMPLFLEIQVEN